MKSLAGNVWRFFVFCHSFPRAIVAAEPVFVCQRIRGGEGAGTMAKIKITIRVRFQHSAGKVVMDQF